jgi:peroxiredoxin
MRALALCLAAAITIPTAAFAQVTKTPTNPQAPRPPESSQQTPQARVHIYGEVYIGEHAPDFSLDGSETRLIKLSRFRGDWVLLVFADRKERLAPLESIHDELRKLGVQIFGVCREKAGTLQAFSARSGLSFPLGADFTGEISSLYGLFDSEHATISPGFLMLDREGIVRMALLGQHLPPPDMARLARFAVTGL